MKFKKAITWLASVYVWALAFVRVTYILTGDIKWPIIIPMMFFSVLLLPLIIAWGVGLWSRSRLLLIGCGVLTALAIALYLPRFNQPNAPTGAETLTVATINPLGDNRMPQGVVDLIAATDADIVGLQELDQNLAALLTSELSEDYPYQRLDPTGIPGMGILSKYPLEDKEFVRQSTWVGNTQAVIVQSPHGDFAWLNQHYQVTAPYTTDPLEFITIIDWTFAERSKNVQDTFNWQDQHAEYPLIITTDFNATDFSDAHQLLTSRNLADTWHEVGTGFGFSFPVPGSRAPLALLPFNYLRLDYVFHTPEFHPLTIEKLPYDGDSDHLGMLATFEYQQ